MSILILVWSDEQQFGGLLYMLLHNNDNNKLYSYGTFHTGVVAQSSKNMQVKTMAWSNEKKGNRYLKTKEGMRTIKQIE